ncbi:hypothetical protein M441DRAFT_276597 [Trichoderma asperellum CBS 433.97]|uniref:Uncharacterized protein n=1 Tax=Trichoderma asperellum (strain ATCC 204424 / CBS 433.97 / NBRC 101777) TaxID=1042311 RepID=A0A2T3YUT7_TRIA4|nr:hypothetical protein M441DRAFT_276597 [Trichoderma asperellum CBS 433.97]PTB36341.1 hypothetical protein M441DRAFT_276597 [Trichoderma asperellum CBS 433.97]
MQNAGRWSSLLATGPRHSVGAAALHQGPSICSLPSSLLLSSVCPLCRAISRLQTGLTLRASLSDPRPAPAQLPNDCGHSSTLSSSRRCLSALPRVRLQIRSSKRYCTSTHTLATHTPAPFSWSPVSHRPPFFLFSFNPSAVASSTRRVFSHPPTASRCVFPGVSLAVDGTDELEIEGLPVGGC